MKKKNLTIIGIVFLAIALLVGVLVVRKNTKPHTPNILVAITDTQTPTSLPPPITNVPTSFTPTEETNTPKEQYAIEKTVTGWNVIDKNKQVLSVILGTNKNIELVKAESTRSNGDSALFITENAILTFIGTSTLVGNYDFPLNGDPNTSEACFVSTKESSIILPDIQGHMGTSFCFDDEITKELYATKNILGKGKAKVTIDKYILLLSPVGGWNRVHLLNFNVLPE